MGDVTEKGTSARLRRELFLHQDGFMLSAMLRGLSAARVLERLGGEQVTAAQLAHATGSMVGPLLVALRCLTAQGWLEREGSVSRPDVKVKLTEAGGDHRPYWPLYVALAEKLSSWRALDPAFLPANGGAVKELGHSLRELFDRRPALPELVRLHLTGAALVPFWLAYTRSERTGGRQSSEAEAFLAQLGWMESTGEWTTLGKDAWRYARSYGIVGSYWPLLSRLPELFSGRWNERTHREDGTELHIDRSVNVSATGAAHQRYYQDADEIFERVFNQPLETQPSFLADMGCGDGSWLVHLYETVKTRTLRGRHLAEKPLVLVGADYNVAALELTQQNLAKAGATAVTLFGDITDPARFAKDLEAKGLEAGDGLHIRAFIDHNRQYAPPKPASVDASLVPQGAYLDENNQPIDGALVEANLVEYLARWLPLVKKHGLVVLEAHCVPPEISARCVGLTHSITFDAYHALSKQYPVDHECFLRAAERAGLHAVPGAQKRYPNAQPFIAVSCTQFRGG